MKIPSLRRYMVDNGLSNVRRVSIGEQTRKHEGLKNIPSRPCTLKGMRLFYIYSSGSGRQSFGIDSVVRRSVKREITPVWQHPRLPVLVKDQAKVVNRGQSGVIDCSYQEGKKRSDSPSAHWRQSWPSIPNNDWSWITVG
jgi:hypothetical protein